MSSKNKAKSKAATTPKVVEEQNLTTEVNETEVSESTEKVETTEEVTEATVKEEVQEESTEVSETTEELVTEEKVEEREETSNETENSIPTEQVVTDTGAQAPYTTEYVEGIGLVKGRPIEDFALGNEVEADEVSEENRQVLEKIAASVAEESSKVVYDFNEKSQIEEEVIVAENIKNTILDVVVTGAEEESEDGEVKPSHVVATDGLSENPEEADVVDNDDNVDPLPEIKGKYYVNVGENLPFNRQEKVENILSKLEYKWIVTALGKFLVGPFEDEESAFRGRKVLLGKGLKGVVVTME